MIKTIDCVHTVFNKNTFQGRFIIKGLQSRSHAEVVLDKNDHYLVWHPFLLMNVEFSH